MLVSDVLRVPRNWPADRFKPSRLKSTLIIEYTSIYWISVGRRLQGSTSSRLLSGRFESDFCQALTSAGSGLKAIVIIGLEIMSVEAETPLRLTKMTNLKVAISPLRRDFSPNFRRSLGARS